MYVCKFKWNVWNSLEYDYNNSNGQNIMQRIKFALLLEIALFS